MFETKTDLYNYQLLAFNKLKALRVCGLFMDMGTGKTRTAIEFINYRKDKISNVIWFCPVTLKQTVFNEFKKHTTIKDRDVYIFNEKTRRGNIPQAFLYIIGIESISSSSRCVIASRSIININSYCIVDESSFIKGHDSLRTMRITKMCENSKYRMILTGTPMTLGVVDLYAQMKFLSPKILKYNSFYSFASNHLEYSDKYPGLIVRAHNLSNLSNKIEPFIYQIKKNDCLDLPNKIYKSRYCEPTKDQLKWYSIAKSEIRKEAIGSFDSYTIFKLLGALQQIASGFWNRYGVILQNNKIEMLKDVLEQIPENEKVIIWCKYKESIEIIKNEIDCNVVRGDQSAADRQCQIDAFANDGKILVSTMQCGGYGLNLSFVHYVVFYENSFNYAHRLQAEDRCHRIGQDHNVIYYDLYCMLNIEDYIANNHYKKDVIISGFINKMKKLGGI